MSWLVYLEAAEVCGPINLGLSQQHPVMELRYRERQCDSVDGRLYPNTVAGPRDPLILAGKTASPLLSMYHSLLRNQSLTPSRLLAQPLRHFLAGTSSY